MKKIGSTNFPWFLVIVIIIILVFLIIYVSADISDISSCESDSDCMIYQVSGSGGYVCAGEDVGESFREKLSMFKYSRNEGMEKRPENCVCTDDVCSPVNES